MGGLLSTTAASGDELKKSLPEIYSEFDRKTIWDETELRNEEEKLHQLKLWYIAMAIGLLALNIVNFQMRRLDFYVYLLAFGLFFVGGVLEAEDAKRASYTWEDAKKETKEVINVVTLENAQRQVKENKLQLTPEESQQLDNYVTKLRSRVDKRKALEQTREELGMKWFQFVFLLSALHGLIGIGRFAYKFSMENVHHLDKPLKQVKKFAQQRL